MPKKKCIIVALCCSITAAVLSFPVGAQTSSAAGQWVSAWSAAMYAPLPFPGLPPSPTFENQTIRMVVRLTLGGERVRIRLSNAFGTTALVIGAAHIALVSQGAKIVSESDHVLTFGGRASASIPPGSPMLSDPVDLKVTSFAEIAVSLYLPNKTPAATVHSWAQHETYIPGQETSPERQNYRTRLRKRPGITWQTPRSGRRIKPVRPWRSAIRLRMALARNRVIMATGRIFWHVV